MTPRTGSIVFNYFPRPHTTSPPYNMAFAIVSVQTNFYDKWSTLSYTLTPAKHPPLTLIKRKSYPVLKPTRCCGYADSDHTMEDTCSTSKQIFRGCVNAASHRDCPRSQVSFPDPRHASLTISIQEQYCMDAFQHFVSGGSDQDL